MVKQLAQRSAGTGRTEETRCVALPCHLVSQDLSAGSKGCCCCSGDSLGDYALGQLTPTPGRCAEAVAAV